MAGDRWRLTLARWEQRGLGLWPENLTARHRFTALELQPAAAGRWCLVASRLPEPAAGHLVAGVEQRLAEARPGRAVRQAFSQAVGFDPAGDTLRAWIRQAFTARSDPTGAAGLRPLVPRPRHRARLHVALGPLGATWSDEGHLVRLAEGLHRRQYAAKRSAAGVAAARQLLQRLVERYEWTEPAQWQAVQGPHVADGPPLPHETRDTQTFNVPDSGTLPDGWLEQQGAATLEVFSNTLRNNSTTHAYASHPDDFGTDHDAKVTHPASYQRFSGPAVRMNAAQCFAFYPNTLTTPTGSVLRRYTGTGFTNLSSDSFSAPANNIYTLTAEGSDLTGLADGVEVAAATSTAYASNEKSGVFVYAAQADTWEGGSLEAGAGGAAGCSGCTIGPHVGL